MSDGRWKISIDAKPEDVAALTSDAKDPGKVILVLHDINGIGLSSITLKNTIPPVGPALEAVTDACKASEYRGSDVTSCKPVPGSDLIEIRCTGSVSAAVRRYENHEIGCRMVPGATGPASATKYGYRLVCSYRRSAIQVKQRDD